MKKTLLDIDICDECEHISDSLTWENNKFLCPICLSTFLETNIWSTDHAIKFFEKNVPRDIGPVYTIKSMHFRNVDFSVIEDGLIQLHFTNCIFENCYFKYHSIVWTTFHACDFNTCRFALLTIARSEFNTCYIYNTDFDNCDFDNVKDILSIWVSVRGMSNKFRNSDNIKSQLDPNYITIMEN